VIVPLADEKSQTDNYFVHEGSIYYITANYAKISSKLGKIFEEEQKKNFIAELNLLYVAFTRPKEALSVLVLTDTLKGGSIQLPALVLGNGLIREKAEDGDTAFTLEFGEIKRMQRGSYREFGEGIETETSLSRFCAKKILTRNIEKRYLVFKSHIIPEDTEMARHGELIHELLSRLKNYDSEKELLSHIDHLAELYLLDEEEKSLIIGYFSRDDIKRFYIGDINFRNEQDIVAYKDKGETVLKRVDRMVIHKERRIDIIDYKIGKEEPHHIEQIEEYRQILKKIYPLYQLKCHLLYVTEDKRMEF
jgi:ATP-dependent exoDNAse (exonuclease V) beta subunit